MKLLLLLIIYISYVTCQRYHVKMYPKKVTPGMIQVINAGKYIKEERLPNPTRMVIEKGKHKYTAFVPIEKGVTLDVPQSALFPQLEAENDSKQRIKKTLPDNVWSLRSKRSVINKVNSTVKKPAVALKGSVQKNIARKKKSRRPKRGGHIKRLRGGKKRKTARSHKKLKGKKGSKIGRNRNLKKKGPNGKSPANKTNKDARRLIGARDADINEYPYVVSIQKNHQHWCTGALLNPKLVITTANCVWRGKDITKWRVLAGTRFTDKGGQMRKVQEIMRHPAWNIRRPPDFDVALASVEGKFKFSASLNAVELPNKNMMPPFADAWVTSWGADRRDGIFEERSNTLQVYHGWLLDRDKCNNITKRFGVVVTENFICFNQYGHRSPCTRDTGSPAVSDGVLWGLASWGIRKICGTHRFPAVFTYIASEGIMDFIMNATRYMMAEERYNPFPDHPPRVPFSRTTPTPMTLPYKK